MSLNLFSLALCRTLKGFTLLLIQHLLHRV
jgi:hypothetical protein